MNRSKAEAADEIHRSMTKPCRACTDFKSWSKLQKQKKKVEKPTESGDAKTAPECPLDREELGRNTWSFLHTMAAYFPEKPTRDQQEDMRSFISLFARFYPCGDCAADLRDRLKMTTPDVSSSHALAQWFCKIHNDISQRLGKPTFDCSKVRERWRDGWNDGSCD